MKLSTFDWMFGGVMLTLSGYFFWLALYTLTFFPVSIGFACLIVAAAWQEGAEKNGR
jgi:hypothetical protein